MNLHTHTKDFTALITFVATHFSITPAFVEKDYWITLVLSRLANSSNVGDAVFKGLCVATHKPFSDYELSQASSERHCPHRIDIYQRHW
jgi:hypothetical protein